MGVHIDERGVLALGHARLKIIDLSENARQPMSNESGTIWVSYNGEIYNFQQLRVGLEARGHQFRSNSDTEVIVHLYEEKGEKLVEDLNGMFAFAVWDERAQRLLLARDRLGVKPVVYCIDEDRLVFASEIRALLEDVSLPRELDMEALFLYLTFNYIPAPYTILRGIRKLEPGTLLVAEIEDDGHLRCETYRYWAPERVAERPIRDREEAKGCIRDLFADAVRIRMVADVPLGAFLSGGVDSSLVAALMAQQASRVRTFTVGYEDIPAYDERRYARLIAERFDTDHEEIVLTAKDVQQLIPDVLARLDEPFGDSSLIPSYVVSRAIRPHATVALSGDGGDEVFGGYTKYRGEVWAQKLARFPGWGAIRGLAKRLPESRGSSLLNKVRMAKRFVAGIDADPVARHVHWMTLVWPGTARSVLTPDALRAFDDATDDGASELPRRLIGKLFSEAGAFDPTNRALYADLRYVLPYDMLAKIDAASMFNSLEVRSPFVDYRLVELGLRIPGEMKVGLFDGKRILKDAFSDVLPKEILTRGKAGFGVPIGEWMRDGLRTMVREILSPERLRKRGVIRPEYAERLMKLHLERQRDCFWELWNLFVFEKWAEKYLD
jgi:asparagine synthase (glutamine-hydrolysing)